MVKIIILKFVHSEFHKKDSRSRQPACLLMKFCVLMYGNSVVW